MVQMINKIEIIAEPKNTVLFKLNGFVTSFDGELYIKDLK